jgi:NitT/TauT family transport system ATP-binding protein
MTLFIRIAALGFGLLIALVANVRAEVGIDALTRMRMQDELLALWDETKFTVIFVTHSIPEAIKIGNRILLLSPHPGQVKAEINSVPRGEESSEAGAELGRKIHTMLFADKIEDMDHA